MTQNFSAPATFRYVAFYDLLADAAFQHSLASTAKESFAMTRYARASITASALSLECTANCILEAVEGSKSLLEELDKLPPLAKIEAAVRLKGITAFDRGKHEVQKAAELIRARNVYVHPRTLSWDAEIHEPQDTGSEWMLPFTIQGERWAALGIPKQAIFWSSNESLAVLKVVCEFLRYLLVEVLSLDEDQLSQMLAPRVELSNVVIPTVFAEFTREMGALAKEGVDFAFLKGALASEAKG